MNSNIPDEAVEAAAGTLHPSWRDHATAEQWQEILRAALEAAAPHMLSEAWEAGREACSHWDIYLDMGGNEPDVANPYRSQP